ncbi:MAG: hypothetical protein KatS3mg105_4621 [Gemmatales bacterium]|nr:MAG: hypothetical protein KatS3mg105_4621 [Gemmatales bacterium]
MGAVEQIVERLERHPELVYRVSSGTVTVEPPTAEGFSVSLTEGAGAWVVAFDGWHEHFTSADEALRCFAFGLSDRCRLRVHLRGSFAYRWAVEERTEAGWREVSVTGLLFFPFWRRPRVVYRQNAVLSSAVPDRGSDEQ